MIYLLLSVISSVGIFATFKVAHRQGIPVAGLITVNYYIAVLTGYLITPHTVTTLTGHDPGFFLLASLIGIFFVVMFLVASASIASAGVSISSAASKLSVIFPFFFSMMIDPKDQPDGLKLTAIAVILSAITLLSLRRKDRPLKHRFLFLPVLLFLGMGGVDTLVKLAQYRYVPERSEGSFSLLVFLFAALSSTIWFIMQYPRRSLFSKKTVAGGIVLGLCNFGSLFFFIRALNTTHAGWISDSSVVFAINNVLIITLTTIAGVLIFRETLFRANWIGLLLALAGIVLLYLNE